MTFHWKVGMRGSEQSASNTWALSYDPGFSQWFLDMVQVPATLLYVKNHLTAPLMSQTGRELHIMHHSVIFK